MRLTLTFIILSLFLLIQGCKYNSSRNKFSKFPIELKPKAISTGFTPHFKFAHLNIYDSLLIITETQTMHTMHLYNKNTFKHVLSAGKKGRGPGEIKNSGPDMFDKKGGIVWTNDWGRFKISQWRLDSLVNNKNYKPSLEYNTPSCIWPVTQFSMLNDSIMLYLTKNPDYFFYAATKEGKIVDSLNIINNTNIYPDVNRNNIISPRWYYYTIHPTKKKICIAYEYADIILGLNFKGNILFQKQGPDNIIGDPKKISNSGQKATYSLLHSDSEFIYCLYNGNKLVERNKNGNHKINYAKNLAVFNWDGKPLARLELEHPAISYAVDRENNKIYTYAPNLGEIICYKLPQIQ